MWEVHFVHDADLHAGHSRADEHARDVGKLLGADYVVEGSVGKSGRLVRVTARLVETPLTRTQGGAVIDALAPLGIRDIAMPATSEAVWRAMRGVSTNWAKT